MIDLPTFASRTFYDYLFRFLSLLEIAQSIVFWCVLYLSARFLRGKESSTSMAS